MEYINLLEDRILEGDRQKRKPENIQRKAKREGKIVVTRRN